MARVGLEETPTLRDVERNSTRCPRHHRLRASFRETRRTRRAAACSPMVVVHTMESHEPAKVKSLAQVRPSSPCFGHRADSDVPAVLATASVAQVDDCVGC